jgi:membrane associated rhomboid family serine protease
VRIPFINTRQFDKYDDTFVGLIKNAICPHFQLLSISSALIGICLLVFLIMHIIYPPGGYSTFLQLPTQMETFALNIQAFVGNKAKFYTLITAMFVHYSYRHIIMNVIFAIFIMYEL